MLINYYGALSRGKFENADERKEMGNDLLSPQKIFGG